MLCISWNNWKICIVHQCSGMPEGNQMVLTLAFWHAHESSEKCKYRTWVLLRFFGLPKKDWNISKLKESQWSWNFMYKAWMSGRSRLVCDRNPVLVLGTKTKITRCLLFKHPSLLRTFGFSAISTYNSYLPSIFEAIEVKGQLMLSFGFSTRNFEK